MSLPDPFSRKPSSAVSPDEEELLGRIMTDLGLPKPAESNRRQFRAIVWRRFWLPRAALAAAVLLIAGVLLWLLLRPASIDLAGQQPLAGGAAQQVDFTVRGPLLLEVSAYLDGRPLAVEHGANGVYSAEVTRNGDLTLAVDPLFGSRVSRTVTVDSLDDERPHIVADERDGGDVVIHLSDGDGSGIDWAGITLTLADGSAYPGLTVDEAAGTVRFPLPDAELHITVPDRSGNQLQATLTPDPAA